MKGLEMRNVRWIVVILLVVCSGVMAAGLGGCATARPVDEGFDLGRALARAEVALETAELALAVWDEAAETRPEIDRWQEERDRLAAAVKEAREVVGMLRRLREAGKAG